MNNIMDAAIASSQSGPHNWQALEDEIVWLQRRCFTLVQAYLEKPETQQTLEEPPALDPKSSMGVVITQLDLDATDRLLLATALAAALRPSVFDPLLVRNSVLERPYAEFGGITHASGVFAPTPRTAAFLLGGDQIAATADVLMRLADDTPLARGRLIEQDTSGQGGVLDRALTASPRLVETLVLGESAEIPFGTSFPAQKLTTHLSWDDLVLAPATQRGLRELITWVTSREFLHDDPHLARWIGGGFSCLFYGVPGTGKTQTAAVLGQRLNRSVYRIDLSMVVSKWVGETEKNLGLVFDKAEDYDWILFFDEADALFGKRSGGSTANDRFANQQVSYLLQRFEQFEGMAILATNLKDNMDEAFSRRFQSVIHFPKPSAVERQMLFEKIFAAESITLSPDVNFAALASAHEVTGAMIVNALRYAVLAARGRGKVPPIIEADDIQNGLAHEYLKQGRTV